MAWTSLQTHHSLPSAKPASMGNSTETHFRRRHPPEPHRSSNLSTLMSMALWRWWCLGDSNTGSHSLTINHVLCTSTSWKPRTRHWTHSSNTRHWLRTRLARPSRHCETTREANTLPRSLTHWQHPLASSDRGSHRPHLSKMELQSISTTHWRRGSLLCYHLVCLSNKFGWASKYSSPLWSVTTINFLPKSLFSHFMRASKTASVLCSCVW